MGTASSKETREEAVHWKGSKNTVNTAARGTGDAMEVEDNRPLSEQITDKNKDKNVSASAKFEKRKAKNS